jgi:membrane protein
VPFGEAGLLEAARQTDRVSGQSDSDGEDGFVDGGVGLVRRLVARLRDEEVTFLAAALAYYAFASLVPFLLLLFAAVSVLGGDELAERVLSISGEILSPVGRGLVEDALQSASGRASATVLSVALLGWSTLKVFRGLDVAFSQVYDTEPASSFFVRIRDATVALLAVGLGLAALVVVNAVVALSGVGVLAVVGPVALVGVLAVVFFPLFYLFPDSDDPPLQVLPGAVVAAISWTLLGTGFRTYAGAAGQFNLYGVFGAVLLLVTWYYVGSMALLLGAALNAVLADRAGETGTNKNPPADTQSDDSA